MSGICCHGSVVFKKEVPICQVLVLGGALSIQALRQLTPLPSPKTGIELLVQCTVSLSRVFHCSGWCGGASLSHLEPHFPYLLNGNKDTTDLSMLF